MNQRITVGVIGDYDPSYTLHLATNTSLGQSGAAVGVDVDVRWIATGELEGDTSALRVVDGVLCSPGSPYRSLDGALEGVRFGRERNVPTLGTCGGCQHMIIEYARNVLGLNARHAEYEPEAEDPVVSALACSLVGRTGSIALIEGSLVAGIYGLERVQEQYFCSFGVDPKYERLLSDGGLTITGRDAEDGVARIFELSEHPFYVATLFVPQARSTPADTHPLLDYFVSVTSERKVQSAAADAVG
jgi:CTP synthase (UTP-ammonia lyase)